MTEQLRQMSMQQPIQCWGCKGDHMYRYHLCRSERIKTAHSAQQTETIEDMGISVHRIYVALNNKQADFQSHMIEVKGKLNNHPIVILIDL